MRTKAFLELTLVRDIKGRELLPLLWQKKAKQGKYCSVDEKGDDLVSAGTVFIALVSSVTSSPW